MENLLFARSQMAISLIFHIIFAAIGIGMPALMVITEALWLRTRDPEYLSLTKAWSKGTAVFFAVGAVSGTVLSFELGLLFPEFMRQAGPLIGPAFALEGFAFFAEGIFLGIYLYAWNRISPKLHLAAGVIVALSGFSSAIFVLISNAWMNAPQGFVFANGEFTQIQPLVALQSPFVLHLTVHMLAAAYIATALSVAAIHAFALLKGTPRRSFHQKAFTTAFLFALPFVLIQPLVGHFAGQQVAKRQPLKLAALERHYQTSKRAPLHIGGISDDEKKTIRGALLIPGGLSFLAHTDFNAEVTGLDAFPREDWPHPMVRYAFQLMVLFGMILVGIAAWGILLWLRKRPLTTQRRFLQVNFLTGPLGFLALEAGWIVTEVGRQPWVIYGFLRTKDAVTPMPGLFIPLIVISLVYLVLGGTVIAILRRYVRNSFQAEETHL
ncbi:MAG TPA: cytochrome ubiquinol oxidase subunit I [Bdellovibrionales bacterium]|nr:MAG: hypothetical protein A2Z97_11460 [Bdellovibrionales bacterium GWB1_52_6]OFZ03872.1 MAG: hypothetical protein A2X97_15850 [Bdellovibrionales bacterium GWA1_52_35]OFZ40290.1 MAG: hypothetical protein A2070_11015 [Bdellovibrionales bacterium GWC1_52_8]HAR42329.1 cytochrome ubiquinol oxidase subunit I [Bdellovibrionales bacterium]HCM39693.1 cytochrome ubiquinol oxidase subunit I [Bdellovibrionales bacterium]